MIKYIIILIAYIFLFPFEITAQTTLVEFNSEWRYLDDGTNQGMAWRQLGFDDSGWKSGTGKLGYGIPDAVTTVGYGPDPKNKYITTYFRRGFSVDDPAAYASLSGLVNRDDGVVIYLNGAEVLRNNMPTGTISYATRASATSGGDDGATPIPFTLPAYTLATGQNTLAVEIHQASPSSSDIAFDLELKGEPATTTENQSPTVSVTSPTDGSSFTLGQEIALSSAASDEDGSVTKVEFLANGNKVGEDATSPYSIGWTPPAKGSYSLTARATDNEGATALSASVTINVTTSTTPPEPAPQGFATITKLSPVSVSTNTGEKPQSKVWRHDGKHWAVLPNSSGTYLWRLDGTSWTSVLRLSTKTSSKADCKLVGNIAHILLFQGRSSQMVSVEYVSGNYQLWSKRTSTVGLSFESGVETATIDIDGNGRMWLASDASSSILVRWSDSPYHTWSSPITIATGLTNDDICAVIAMPGKIGVLWSNQNTQRFGFKTHTNGASPSSWSSDEVPAAQSALSIGSGMSDDHLNMAIAGDGTLYCAVKTSYDTNGYPQIALLLRSPTGSWDNLYSIAPIGTRPIVVLNESKGLIRVMYTSGDNGGDILYRESSISPIQFSSQLTLIKGGSYNNSTSTKDNFTTDIVILASSSTEAVGVLASDGTVSSPAAPHAPLLASPLNGATNFSFSPTLSWNVSDGAASYHTQVSTSSGFSSTVYDQSGIQALSASVNNLSESTKYYWRVRASNSAGTSAWSTVWEFTTTNGTSQPPAGALVGYWRMNEGSGSTLVDDSGQGNHAITVASPTWVTGKDGLALRLNGTDQYAYSPDNASLDITGAITLAAWIRPEKKATQYLIKKSVNGSTDGYELSLASSGEFFFRINQASSADTYRLNSVTAYPTNGSTWMHVAATFDGSNIRLYVNGNENAVKTFPQAVSIAANSLPLYIGAQGNGAYKYKGAVDEVRVYNSALSASEISLLVSGSAFATTTSNSLVLPGIAQNIVDNKEFTAYPNPIETKATIKFALSTGTEYVINLYDSKGQQIRILKQGKTASDETSTFEFDGSDLPKGLYIVRLQFPDGNKSLKLILDR